MTRKDFRMDWDQIERQWAAMTRRVRSDCSTYRADAKAAPAPRATRTDASPARVADQQMTTALDERLKMSIE
jgi:hypothetical protein